MNIIQCANGHFYDSEKYGECPHCAGQEESVQKTKSVALDAQKAGSYAEEYIKQNLVGASAVQAASSKVENDSAASSKTKKDSAAVSKEENGSVRTDKAKAVGVQPESDVEEHEVIRYTAGWLVCVSGADYGKSFPLYAGFNRIGRDRENDIILKDPHVSREIHCSVIYEERKNIFYIFPQADTLSYIGDELVDRAVEMGNGQVVTIGETQLELVAYCIGEKRWPKRNL